jgi:hypothetical protein
LFIKVQHSTVQYVCVSHLKPDTSREHKQRLEEEEEEEEERVFQE